MCDSKILSIIHTYRVGRAKEEEGEKGTGSSVWDKGPAAKNVYVRAVSKRFFYKRLKGCKKTCSFGEARGCKWVPILAEKKYA